MITILALTTFFNVNGVRENMPKVSYLSYIDICMVVCLVFAICCMFEFVDVVFLIQPGKEKLSIEMKKICRVVFPVIFVTFMILYCTIAKLSLVPA